MIIKPPETRYDVEIYECIMNDPEYNEFSEGEKSILYDLCHEVRKYITFNWSDINIPNYVYNCFKGYKKNKNVILVQVIANCINVCFPDKLARLEGGSIYESKHLVITDRPPKEEKKEEVKEEC